METQRARATLFSKDDVLYANRPGIVEPVPSKVVVDIEGPNYVLCSYNDPQYKSGGIEARHLALSRERIILVEKNYCKMNIKKENKSNEQKEESTREDV